MKRIFILLCVILIASSCNRDDVIETTMPPDIILDSPNGIYTVKSGREILIAPQYESAEGAAYRWTSGGRELGSSPSLSFSSLEIGQYYITLSVTTRYGTDEEEIRVDVVELEVPIVSLSGSERSRMLPAGRELTFSPAVKQTSLPTACAWWIDGRKVSDEREYTFRSDETGTFALKFAAENEDGSDSVEFEVIVCSEDQMPVHWAFEQTVYNYSSGRAIRLAPTQGFDDEQATYLWTVDGQPVQEGASSEWICDLDEPGTYRVEVTATLLRGDAAVTLSQELVVNVCPPEGTYYRARSGASQADWTKVFAYVPAPGQFINELKTGGFDGTQTTHEAAVAYAEKRMSEVNWCSLGGFGGYIVVGFDHSIDNTGDYDFAILGNSFDTSSEPGIVWVMQDENGDGEPNDTWYELRGCETGAPNTVQDYAVTYYRPRGAGMPVQWTDNLGGSGEIDYLKTWHSQDYYYPLWIEADSYTLRGTRLEARNYDQSGNGTYWVQPPYEWGYADNFSPVDRLSGDENAGAAANANHFKISHAMDYAGNPVTLKYIDFIKVQTGLNTKSGWLGENSTEVYGFYDYSLKKQTNR